VHPDTVPRAKIPDHSLQMLMRAKIRSNCSTQKCHAAQLAQCRCIGKAAPRWLLTEMECRKKSHLMQTVHLIYYM